MVDTHHDISRSARNSALAGYAAGITGVVLGHPLDSAKVWMQTNSVGKNAFLNNASTNSGSSSFKSPSLARGAAAPSPKGSLALSTMAAAPSSTSRGVWRTLRALYSGASGPLCTVGFVQSVNFATYDSTRRILHRQDPRPDKGSDSNYLHHDSLVHVALAGAVSGAVLTFLTSPLALVKTHQQITGQTVRQSIAATLLKPNGQIHLSACFLTGIYPHFASETLGRAVYYAVYEACKRSRQDDDATKVTLAERMVSAAIAGISCWALIFPLDSLRNRLYSRATTAGRVSTWATAKLMYQEGSLYRGFGVTLLRAGPVAATVLPVYDLVLDHLNSHNR